jgi:hypothetical protein
LWHGEKEPNTYNNVFNGMSPSVRLVLYKTTLTGEDSGSSLIQSLIGDSAGKLTNYKGFLPADVYNVFFTGQWW